MAATLLACAGLAGLRHTYWILVEYRFVEIDAGKMYQSAAIPPEELLTVVARHGIRTVVDLRKPGEDVDAEREALTAHDVRHVHLPARQVPDDETVEAFLRLTDDPASYPMLVHCRHGCGRAVLFAALYRIEHLGWDNDRARRATRLLPDWSSFAADEGKGRYLLEYRPRRARALSSGSQGQ